jgi:hypothetical protein
MPWLGLAQREISPLSSTGNSLPGEARCPVRLTSQAAEETRIGDLRTLEKMRGLGR